MIKLFSMVVIYIMSHSYNFQKTGVLKSYALDSFLTTAFSFFDSLTYSDPDLKINTTEELSNEQLETLTSFIQSYTDPEVFLQLNSTMTDCTISIPTSSITPQIIQTFIWPTNSSSGSGVFNSIKMVLEYSCQNIESFVNIDPQATFSATLQIFCHTRNITLEDHTIDITNIVQEWRTLAQNGQTGPIRIFTTFMIEGMRNKVANYDCIWHIKGAVSNSNITLTKHGIQMLYYDLM